MREVSPYVRHIVLPVLVGVAIGFGLEQLPPPANVVTILAVAAFGLIYSVWSFVDLRRSKRRFERLAAEAQEYIAHYDHRAGKA